MNSSQKVSLVGAFCLCVGGCSGGSLANTEAGGASETAQWAWGLVPGNSDVRVHASYQALHVDEYLSNEGYATSVVSYASAMGLLKIRSTANGERSLELELSHDHSLLLLYQLFPDLAEAQLVSHASSGPVILLDTNFDTVWDEVYILGRWYQLGWSIKALNND